MTYHPDTDADAWAHSPPPEPAQPPPPATGTPARTLAEELRAAVRDVAPTHIQPRSDYWTGWYSGIDRALKVVDELLANHRALRQPAPIVYASVANDAPADSSPARPPTVPIEGGHVIELGNGGRCIHCGEHTERIRSHGYSCEEFRRQHGKA